MRTDGTSAAAVCHFLSHSALPLSLPSLARSLPLQLQRPAVVVVRRADLLVRSRFLPPSFPPGPRSADCRAGLRCDSLSNPPKRTPPPPPPPPRFLTSSRSSSVRRRATAGVQLLVLLAACEQTLKTAICNKCNNNPRLKVNRRWLSDRAECLTSVPAFNCCWIIIFNF